MHFNNMNANDAMKLHLRACMYDPFFRKLSSDFQFHLVNDIEGDKFPNDRSASVTIKPILPIQIQENESTISLHFSRFYEIVVNLFE